MDNNFNTPAQIVEGNIKGAVTKANLPLLKMILLGIMAGAFIAFGGEASSLAMHNISDVGLARTLAGTIFPVGLMMIVLIGGELFTGNCLMTMAVWEKKITLLQMVRNLVVVFFSNMIGALFVVVVVYFSGQFDYSAGTLGAFTIKVAVGKVNLNFLSAVCSGILCNVLVCIAVLMAATAKDIAGKCLAIFFPIWAFVISGFEHCVANMWYIPAGLIAKNNQSYVDKAMELYGYTSEQIDSLSVGNMFLKNLLPVTIGNIIGGGICVGGILFLVYRSKKVNKAD